jgi:hypothetical protein
MENSVMKPPPKLIVKFWPPSVTAEGVQAINAIRRPLAFAVYMRPVVAIAMILAMMWAGADVGMWALRIMKSWF